MDPLLAASLASTGLDLLEKAKKLFQASKTINEAKEMAAKAGDNAESLQEQVRINQQIIDKLIQQAEENKELLKKHNDILINVERDMLQLNAQLKTTRIIAIAATVIAVVAIGIVVIRLV
jgi:hypothetical protein